MEMKTLGWLTPSLAPTVYDLAIMLQSDTIILADTMQYNRKARVHRGRVHGADIHSEGQWVNIPAQTEDKKKPLTEVRIAHEQEPEWQKIFWQTLHHSYSSAVYYDYFEEEIRALIGESKNYSYLLPFVYHFRNRLFRFVELPLAKNKYKYLSQFFESGNSEDSLNPDPEEWRDHYDAEQIMQEQGSRHYIKQSPPIQKKEPDLRGIDELDDVNADTTLLDLLFRYGPESFYVFGKIGGGNQELNS